MTPSVLRVLPPGAVDRLVRWQWVDPDEGHPEGWFRRHVVPGSYRVHEVWGQRGEWVGIAVLLTLAALSWGAAVLAGADPSAAAPWAVGVPAVLTGVAGDLLASAVEHERRRRAGPHGSSAPRP